MTRLICIDLETTGVDVEACEVVQVGGIEVETDDDPVWVGAPKTMLCGTLRPIPASAAAVHGITDEDVAGAPLFVSYAQSVIDWLDSADIVVTFNGATFDLPIIARHRLPRGWQPKRHIDVFRLWQYLRKTDSALPPYNLDHAFPPSVMAGSLTASHYWSQGRGFGDAHDAVADCRATLDVLRAFSGFSNFSVLHKSGAWGLDRCVELTAAVLPGDVDWSGKLKWDGDEVVFSFGKHKGKPVSSELGSRGYVHWMLSKGDFPKDTCDILRAMTMGQFPERVDT